MYIILIVIVIVGFIIYLNSRKKQLFENIIVGNELDKTSSNIISFIKSSTKDILIGNYNDNELIYKSPINIKGDLYIKDKLKIGNTELDIADLRKIKSLPYMFDKEICLRDDTNSISCIKPEHIEMLNGRRAMVINTFPEVYPYTFYTGINYGNNPFREKFEINDDTSHADGSVPNSIIYYKSVKILDGYSLRIFPKINKEGSYKIIKGDVPDITTLGEEWEEGIKSYWPETEFGSNNISDKMCMTSVKFGPWQQIVNGPQDIYTNIFRGEPCLFKENQEFVINKNKLYYNTPHGPKIHRHVLNEVHEDI